MVSDGMANAVRYENLTDETAVKAEMRWFSVLSRQRQGYLACEEAVEALHDDMGLRPPDLVLAFFTSVLAEDVESIHRCLTSDLSPGCLLGVSGAGVVASQEEIERGAALVLIAAHLPGVRVSPLLIAEANWFDPIEDPLEFSRHAPHVQGSEVMLLLGDPFSVDLNRVLRAINHHAPGLRVVGGMASAGQRPGENSLFINDWVGTQGAIAVSLSGDIRADVVVSQGCRPLGPVLEVTRARENLIRELDGLPATERLQQVFEQMSENEQQLLRQGLLMGRPARGGATGRGDYVIRNLIGHDPKTGSLAVGDIVRERERVRLHVRDAQTAREDLELLLSPQCFDSKAGAALVFSCNGRGRNLFPEPNSDIGVLQSALGGPIPAAGLFCAGEVGPVGETNFVHGHTASIAIFRSAH